MEILDIIIKICAAVSAVIGFMGFVVLGVKWFLRQKQQDAELESLRKTENEDIKSVKEELCVLSYAMLAALDGLKQQGCNGDVTKAYNVLQKHLNITAHDTEQR